MKNTLHKIFTLAFFGMAFTTNAQDLNNYIEEALENNPEIQSYRLQYEIAEEKLNEASTLGNTEFGAGYFVSEPETRTGPQRFKLSVKQMLPWFGTITARENYASSLAESSYTEIAIAKRKLALSIAQSYYKLFALQANQKVLQEQIDLIQNYQQLALTGVEVGKTSAVKVFQLQIRENELEKEQKVFQQEYMAEQSVFNSLLNKNNKTIVVTENLEIPEISDEIKRDSLTLHPELLKYDALYNSIARAEMLNQKVGSPNLGIGVDYINVSERTDMDVVDNGKDIFMPMVTLSIPIFNKTIQSKTVQNQLQQEEIEAKKIAKLNELNSYLDQAVSNRTNARIDFETQLKNLEQTKNAEEILIRNYETERMNFDDLLDILDLQLQIQLKKIAAIKKYYTASAILNYITNI
ncbi:TolC family protein [Galbibacter sp. BG1]|uniref:TolC family protein n=1 Tax=Galbibacter sp. BG1 TaxID=1170699 RepID=UPI0015BD35AD|nr:TolC family protein [Galbibacter sp. BG1]QLE02805.1 TolC family protein [Galbibacter sp. BG1]